MPGYSIEMEKAQEIGLEADEVVSEWKPHRSVYTVIRVEDKLRREDLQPAYDWIGAHNFSLAGDILAWVLKIVFDHGKVSITHTLNGRDLTVAWKVVNKDQEIMYFTIGAHPAFNVPANGNNDKKVWNKSKVFLIFSCASKND